MKALTVLVKHLPSHMGQHFQSIVATVWGCLVTTSEAYVRSSVATDAEDLADDPVDSDGKPCYHLRKLQPTSTP